MCCTRRITVTPLGQLYTHILQPSCFESGTPSALVALQISYTPLSRESTMQETSSSEGSCVSHHAATATAATGATNSAASAAAAAAPAAPALAPPTATI